MGLKAAANPNMKFPRKDTMSLVGMLSTLALVIQVTMQISFSETIGYAFWDLSSAPS
jgi:hypothetical protein